MRQVGTYLGNHGIVPYFTSDDGFCIFLLLFCSYLNMTLKKDSGIRKQDLTAVFSAVYNGNPENVKIALEFLKNNLTEIAHT